ncbi:MAG: chemotaxis protein CheA [Fimbriimonadaceae bacterium]|nr:chemotaxis protein CheA [Fimbriimonadaceae bacterium]
MSAELDMSQYIDLFLQEADEQLEILEQETLKLETDPSQDRMQVIFRAAHTLKGSSRAMGFSGFAELTHELENILDLLRQDRLELTTDAADGMLACIDALVQMKEAIAAGRPDTSIESGVLVQRLAAIASGQADSAPAPRTVAEPQADGQTGIDPSLWDALDAAAAESPVLRARFRLHSECVMKFVRAYMAISAIQEKGELLATWPSAEALEEEEFDRDFELVFQTKAGQDELSAKLSEISEIESFQVSPWSRPEPEAVSTPEPEAAKPAEPAGAAPDAAAAPRRADPARRADTGQTVRVDVARLDNLMNLVGELVIDRTRIAQIASDLAARGGGGNEDLQETVSHIARITFDLQDQIMKARMMPIETVFNRFPRVVRDLAQKLGKDVKLEMLGGETELDRSVIEVIGDPLLHILRNSIDHGLETPEERRAAGKSDQGLLLISARHQENHIVIEIRDDGRGIDPEKIKRKAVSQGLATEEQAARMTDKDVLQFIFGSGFSTATQVSEVSGRGVGMDIVRSNIQKLGGLIDLDSKVGEGTTTILRLPLTLAIIRGLLVRVEGRDYVLPLGSVVETMLLAADQIQRVKRREVVVIRGVTTPLLRLQSVFSDCGREDACSGDQAFIVVVGLADQRIGLVVDSLIGEQEVVIKSLSGFLGEVPGVSGATILGDGKVALIVDVGALVSREAV